MRIGACGEHVVTYQGIGYYIDIQGRTYHSLGGLSFEFPEITDEKILLGIASLPEIQKGRKEIEDYREAHRPKTAPQPAKRFLP